MNLDILSKLLESASCGAYAVSIDQTIVLWNRNAERILGHSSQNVLGRKCYEVMEGVTSIGLTPQCLGGCPSMHYLRAGLIPAVARLQMLCSTGERKWVSLTPMVVAGILRDAPLLVHLFDDGEQEEDFDQTRDSVHEALAESGAQVISDHPPPAPLGEDPALSRRELEVLRLVALGWDTPRIAAELGISRHTVRNHIRNLRHKLNATTKAGRCDERHPVRHPGDGPVIALANSPISGAARYVSTKPATCASLDVFPPFP